MPLNRKIKVLIVDDSALVRQVLSEILKTDPDIEIVGAAADPIFAEKYLKEPNYPDVIVLDIEMPRMDGITFLRKLMSEHPTPVVMCSSLTEKGAEATIQALAAGAVDIITKPKLGVKNFLTDSGEILIGAVRSAAMARVGKLHGIQTAPRPASPPPAAPAQAAPAPPAKPVFPGLEIRPKLSADAVLEKRKIHAPIKTEKFIALGASTGGTQAIEDILKKLPQSVQGIVIVQHMPEKFTTAFADRLNNICEVEVKEAEDGDRVVPGRVLIAPGSHHMLVVRDGSQFRVKVIDGPLVNRHRPSVDVLFRSVANEAGANAMGVILTGMGDDGALGMLEMKETGSFTIAQDEASCIVYGMPKEAVLKGGVSKELPLASIPQEIIQYSK